MLRVLWAGTFYSLASVAGAGEFRLEMPVNCELGETCFIQQYVDHDKGPGALDFTCGPLVYDTHTGTDVALPSLAAMQTGVDVLASATGTVRGVRDGMPDVIFSSENNNDIAGRECGNGVVLTHRGGWETQYCHLKKASVKVRVGQVVQAGDVLGQIGLSGQTEFPHLHLSVRRDGQHIDPFAPDLTSDCGEMPTQTLWETPIDYVPGGIISAGFSDTVPEFADIKSGASSSPLVRNPGALVAWVYVFGGRRGDTLLIEIDGPDGVFHRARISFDRTQAQLFRASGKQRPEEGWASGPYSAFIRLIRGRAVIDEQDFSVTLP
jgi:hypothetical protein